LSLLVSGVTGQRTMAREVKVLEENSGFPHREARSGSTRDSQRPRPSLGLRHHGGFHPAHLVDVSRAQAGGAAKACCMGLNECKGKGGCAVPESNSCAGKNDCKGKGGCNMHCPK
jgi:hypothetical protein